MRPTTSPMTLERCSVCTLPVSVLPSSGTWPATAFSTSALNDSSTEAIRPRIVTSTSSSGNMDTNAEYARLETSTPPLSSPYFFTTPKTNAVGVKRRCVWSTFLSAFSTGFTAPASLPRRHAAAHRLGGQTSRRRPVGSEGGVYLGFGRSGVVTLGHRGGQPGAGAGQPLFAHRGQPLAALPQLKRLFQGQAARLQALDHGGQLVPGLLIGQRLRRRGLLAAVRHGHNLIRHRRHPYPSSPSPQTRTVS